MLRLRYDAKDLSDSLVLVPDADGDEGTFQLTVLPPVSTAPSRPRDLVLVLDHSGSMAGWKMVAARRAAARIVDTLTSGDRFAVLTFDDRINRPSGLPEGLVEASDRHRYRAVEHLARVDARGDTEMLAPLRQALTLLGAADEATTVIPAMRWSSSSPTGRSATRTRYCASCPATCPRYGCTWSASTGPSTRDF